MRVKVIDRKLCMGCKNCELACIAVHSDKECHTTSYQQGIAEVDRARNKVELDKDGKLFPQFCRHCPKPACVEACMSGALEKGEDGLVVCDQEKCVGCFMCVMSCPFGMARPNMKLGGKLIKCDGCAGRDSMACVDACPSGCLTVEEDPEATRAVKVKK